MANSRSGLALGLERCADLLLEDLLVEHVLDADPEPRGLVRVAGADAALRGADLALAQLRLAGVVEQQVVRHDQVRVSRHAQAAQVDAALGQAVHLAAQYARVDDDAVADHAQLAGVEDAGRDQVELERLAVAHDRVAGVVAALEADHGMRPLGKQVDDLALALVAPLGTDYHESWHDERSLRRVSPRASAGRRHGAAAGRHTSPRCATRCASRAVRVAPRARWCCW